MTAWWVSCCRFTVGVETQDGVITEAAPIVRRFIGQPLDNLVRWAKKLGGFEMVKLEDINGK